MRTVLAGLVAVMGAAVVIHVHAGAVAGQTPAPKVFVSPSGAELRVLVDAAALGGTEVEVAELTLKPGSDSGDHRHAVTETFYVLEGGLEQVINGTPVKLGPGMAASLRATDTVRHRAGPDGAKVLVVWAPGGEIARVTAKWKAR